MHSHAFAHAPRLLLSTRLWPRQLDEATTMGILVRCGNKSNKKKKVMHPRALAVASIAFFAEIRLREGCLEQRSSRPVSRGSNITHSTRPYPYRARLQVSYKSDMFGLFRCSVRDHYAPGCPVHAMRSPRHEAGRLETLAAWFSRQKVSMNPCVRRCE